MEEDEVIFIDDDERNAVSRRRRPSRIWGRRPGRVASFSSRRPVIVRPVADSVEAAVDRGRTSQVIVAQPRPVLAGFSNGELIEMAAQIIAAIQPLPAAPTAQGETEIDLENLVTYQSALALHAKRDEQLRTLGNLVGRLLR